jgi:hypothetical protein
MLVILAAAKLSIVVKCLKSSINQRHSSVSDRIGSSLSYSHSLYVIKLVMSSLVAIVRFIPLLHLFSSAFQSVLIFVV